MSRTPLPATAQLFEAYAPVVYRRCLALLQRPDLASDAVQDVFLKVLQRRGDFRGESSPLTWLYGIATLHCLQQLRNQGRRQKKLALLHAEAVDRPPPLSSPEDRLTLAALLQGEPEAVVLTVTYRIVDGMSLEEVAAALGCSSRAISKRLRRFLRSAKEHLAQPADAPAVAPVAPLERRNP